MTPLCLAAQPRFFERYGVTGCGAAAVRRLLRLGASANARRPSNGVSAAFYAVKYGDLETVEALAEEGGADLNVRNAKGGGLLYAAAVGGHVEILSYLLKRGVSPLEFRERAASLTADGAVEWTEVSELELMLYPWTFR